MSNNVLGTAALELTHRIQMHFPGNISPEMLAAWNHCPKEILTERLSQMFGTLPEPPESVLQFLGTTTIPATTGTFVARDRFVADTGSKAKVKISHLGYSFAPRFLQGCGKIEEAISETTLRYHILRKPSVDTPIVAELGGEGVAETTLTEAFSLMEKQRDGGAGVLLNTGWANIFYIRDMDGVLCGVNVHWGGAGWGVLARPVDYRGAWGDGDLVFSRSSVA